MPRFIETTDAIRVLSEYYNYRTDAENCRLAIAISKVPTADVPERNVGKWIWQGSVSEGCWVCSECKHKFYQGYGNENFCPNCGADMRKETEDVP